MTTEEDQDTRAKFYSSRSLAKYIVLNGVPRSTHAFSDMVASGASEDLTSEEGTRLITCLRQVAFLKHAQQTNIMDKTNGRIIATITR